MFDFSSNGKNPPNLGRHTSSIPARVTSWVYRQRSQVNLFKQRRVAATAPPPFFFPRSPSLEFPIPYHPPPLPRLNQPCRRRPHPPRPENRPIQIRGPNPRPPYSTPQPSPPSSTRYPSLPSPSPPKPAPDPDDPRQQIPCYRLPIAESHVKLHRDLPPTRMWTIGGCFPGPDPRIAHRPGHDRRVAEPPSHPPSLRHRPRPPRRAGRDVPDVRAVIHLHGGRTPAASSTETPRTGPSPATPKPATTPRSSTRRRSSTTTTPWALTASTPGPE